jgi:uncharacterized protein YlxP (DUF503 family)
MNVGILTLQLQLPGCRSLKEKRSRLKALLARLRREFNLSAAEVDQQDLWQSALVACALVSNQRAHTQRSLQQVVHWIETTWPDVTVQSEQIEII